MSCFATHIRFANDLKTKYKIKNLNEYFSGAIYPDSRWLCGIRRSLTHSKKILASDFAKTDFKKGWKTHQICDDIFDIKIKELLNDYSLVSKNADKEWAMLTSVKFIQDICDIKYFKLQKYLQYLTYAYNPNGEDIDNVTEYNHHIIKLYKNKKNPEIQDYCGILKIFGISKYKVSEIYKTCEKLIQDKKITERINNLYSDGLNFFNKI
ncbi:MAG: hypothetical protein V1860_04375 [bacterium]